MLRLFTAAGFNVETVEYKNISFTVWDVGGQDKVGKTAAPPSSTPCLLQRPPHACFCLADSPAVEALLPEHTGPHFRGGQQ
jgi:hypothetical protein